MYELKLNGVKVMSPTTFTCVMRPLKIEEDIECLNGATVSGFTRYKRMLTIEWEDISDSELNAIINQIYKNTNRTVTVTAYDVYDGVVKTITYNIDSEITPPVKLWKGKKHYYTKATLKLLERSYWK